MRFSKTERNSHSSTYYFEEDMANPDNGMPGRSIYDEAKTLDEFAVFELDGLEPERQLQEIVYHVKVRIKITQVEIFKIGELLCKAKKTCSKNQIGFKDWIEQEFDFSYETANNFMNVHRQCFGAMKIAVKIPPSILYKISKPRFPEELREYLFEKADFDKLTNGKLPKLKKKYDEGGLEAVEEDIEEISRASLADRQIRRRMDLVENYLRHLNEIICKYKGDYTGATPVEFEKQLTSLEPEAVEISRDLMVVIEKAYDMVDTAYEEAKENRERFISKAKERM